MKYKKKQLLVIIGSLVFLSLFGIKILHKQFWLYVYNLRIHTVEKIDVSYIKEDGGREIVHPFYDGSNFCAVIPAHWDKSAVTIEFNEEPSILEDLFVDVHDVNLKQIHSPAVFLSLSDNDFESIDVVKKKHKGGIKCFNEEGAIGYESQLSWIHGRGSSSWTESNKKSYSFKTKENIQLFGLNSSKKFCLISNCFDPTHLRNFLAFRVAERIGMTGTPKSQHVQLWINGCYRGLYLLTNKIEVSEFGLNIHEYEESDNLGVFLCHIEQSTVLKEGEVGFISRHGQPVCFEYPKKNTRQRQLFELYFNKMEDALLAASEEVHKFVDVKSWKLYYLCQEVFLNVDAGRRSFYFYKYQDSVDSKIHLGPLWDFDHSMKVWENPSWPNSKDELYAASGRGIETYKKGYPGLLSLFFHNKNYQDSVRVAYWQEMRPILSCIFEGSEYDSLTNALSDDVMADASLWNPLHKDIGVKEFFELKRFVNSRIISLDSIFSISHVHM